MQSESENQNIEPVKESPCTLAIDEGLEMEQDNETRCFKSRESLIKATIFSTLFFILLFVFVAFDHLDQTPTSEAVPKVSETSSTATSTQPVEDAPRISDPLQLVNTFALQRLKSQRNVYVLLCLLLVLIAGVVVAAFFAGFFTSQRQIDITLVVSNPEPDGTDHTQLVVSERSFWERMQQIFAETSILVVILWVVGGFFSLFSLLLLFIDLALKHNREWDVWRWSSLLFVACTIIASVCLGLGSTFGGPFTALMMAASESVAPLVWLSIVMVAWLAYGLYLYISPGEDFDAPALNSHDLLMIVVTSLTMGAMGGVGGVLGSFCALIVVTCTLLFVVFVRKLYELMIVRNRKILALVIIGVALLIASVPVAYFEPFFGGTTFVLSLFGILALTAVKRLDHRDVILLS